MWEIPGFCLSYKLESATIDSKIKLALIQEPSIYPLIPSALTSQNLRKIKLRHLNAIFKGLNIF
ncbi:hypothetical protein C7B69_23650 [filamentous cyanobacterium Phorm 46]|nr:hypothetical protein C7B69_23650 [filamentous cyanobacterium Phorm 46]PSB50027.1 hypothetical protein C7B67_16045 [filamentous cyanobacterium Phorm 6]